jgi:hypothetical protein
LLKGLIHLAGVLIQLAQEKGIVGLGLGTRGQIIRAGWNLGLQEGPSRGAGGCRQGEEKEVKKNPSAEGHEDILWFGEILKYPFSFYFLGAVLSNAE